MIIEIIVMYPIQDRDYRPGIDNLLVLLIGGIPIAMPTVLSVTMAIGSHRLSQQVWLWFSWFIYLFIYFFALSLIILKRVIPNMNLGSYHEEDDSH